MRFNFTDHIRSLPSSVPFVGPETAERSSGRVFTARIGANENSFGPSPKAIKAMEEAAKEQWKYGDPENYDLRTAIAKKHNISIDNVVVGLGIDTLLGVAVRLFVEPNVSVVTSNGAYPTFNFHVDGFGGKLIKVPYVEDRESIPDLVAATHAQDARVVYLANPDNPMGTWWAVSDIEKMATQLPTDAILFLDEAYCEFVPDGAVPKIDITQRNVLRFRTFSKAYGLAGARVGYAIGDAELISAFNKVRNHFEMNRAAQIGALAAFMDGEWLSHIQTSVAAGRDRIYSIAQTNGLTTIPSATNFVTIDCGKDADFANKVLEKLTDLDVFVRKPFAYPGNRCIRVGVGADEELNIFAKALPIALANASNGLK